MRARRSFFKRLQQRVTCLSVHPVGLFDDDDARASFVWPKVRLALDGARLIDRDEALLRPHQSDILMLAPRDQSSCLVACVREPRNAHARGAFVARFDAARRATVERL